MNRLAFRPLLRASHALHRPCLVHQKNVKAAVSGFQQARRLASTKPPTTAPTAEFEAMLTSLYSGMKVDDLAKRVAVLFMTTDRKNEIEQVEKRLHSIMRGQNLEQVTEKIKHYLQNPPEDILLRTRSEPESVGWLDAKAQRALSDAGITTFEYLSTLMESEPSVKLLNNLETATNEAIEHDWVAFRDKQDTGALQRILNFYSRNGLDFVAPSEETAPLVKQIRERAKTTGAPGGVESDLEAYDQDIIRSNIAARDTTLNRFEPPPVEGEEFPDLMYADPILDPQDVIDFPPTEDCPFHNRIIVRNHRSVFHKYEDDPSVVPEVVETVDEFVDSLPVPKRFYDSLHQSILIRRGVVQQTGKGKIRRVSYTVLVGNADGLVGMGEGKHANSMIALKSARLAAVRNMDWVERFEKRTVWTEMRTKLGGTELILRPRPVGFGLRCNPYLHQILRAAGFKDISAKVWGSRNRLNVIKAAFRLLQAGHDPTGMGDGLGGPGRKLNKGSGLISKQELERARGRKLISLRK